MIWLFLLFGSALIFTAIWAACCAAGRADRRADGFKTFDDLVREEGVPADFQNLPTARSTGTSQSRPFPARPGKVMESAGHRRTVPRRTEQDLTAEFRREDTSSSSGTTFASGSLQTEAHNTNCTWSSRSRDFPSSVHGVYQRGGDNLNRRTHNQ